MWIWLWLLFIFVLFLLPVGYGWGYRGWGPPYPSYYRRRRGLPARDAAMRDLAAQEAAYEETSGWGWLADLVWIAFVIGLIWLLLALLV